MFAGGVLSNLFDHSYHRNMDSDMTVYSERTGLLSILHAGVVSVSRRVEFQEAGGHAKLQSWLDTAPPEKWTGSGNIRRTRIQICFSSLALSYLQLCFLLPSQPGPERHCRCLGFLFLFSLS